MTDFDAIFAALQATGVRYVIVGGVAGRQQDLLDVEKLEKLKQLRDQAGDSKSDV